MIDSPPDADLDAMRRLVSGDDLALNELMQRWKDKLAAYLYRLTGSHDAAVDLAQETFVRLYQSRGRYKPTTAFATYLFIIASNLARNHQRWRSRHPVVSIEECTDDVQRAESESGSPDAMADQSELRDQVERAIASLPPDLREALHLFTYEQMSQSDIARVLGCSVKAVETRIYRARQMLRTLLAESADMEPEPELQFEPEANASYELAAIVLNAIKASGVTKFGFVGNEKYRSFGK